MFLSILSIEHLNVILAPRVFLFYLQLSVRVEFAWDIRPMVWAKEANNLNKCPAAKLTTGLLISLKWCLANVECAKHLTLAGELSSIIKTSCADKQQSLRHTNTLQTSLKWTVCRCDVLVIIHTDVSHFIWFVLCPDQTPGRPGSGAADPWGQSCSYSGSEA